MEIQNQAINRNPRQFIMMMMMMVVVVVVVFCMGNLGSNLNETDTQATNTIFFFQILCLRYSY
jgi:hypothetical protein